MRSMLTFLLFLALAGPSLASDGVLEINQVCAVQTGCFAGDSPGFPVTIDGSAGSSYLLTGDLTIPDENTSGVTIEADYITIDLGGHRVIGPVTCSGTPTVCAPTGTGRGVFSGPNTGVRIRNGSVIGMGDHGIGTNAGGSIEDVIASQNAGVGIFLGPSSSVDRSQAFGNGGDGIVGTNWVRVSNSASVANGGKGIFVGGGSNVSDNRANGNGDDGIEAGSACTISGNTAQLNAERGIDANDASTISDNAVAQNGSNGIHAGAGSTVSNNTAHDNGAIGIVTAEGSTVSDNATSSNGDDGMIVGNGSTIIGNASFGNGDATSDDGIECSTGCFVQGNSVQFNKGFGIRLSTPVSNGSSYRENVVSLNTAGAVSGGADAGANVINGVVTPTP